MSGVSIECTSALNEYISDLLMLSFKVHQCETHKEKEQCVNVKEDSDKVVKLYQKLIEKCVVSPVRDPSFVL